MREEIDIVVISESVCLNTPNGFLCETGRERILAENQFVGPLGILNTDPGVVPGLKTRSRLKEIAVENGIIFEVIGCGPTEL